ncbi:Holliday junction branch migration DNA helicase RuvB [Patescibacteria group bacterium]|nr:Holliday junction branch migration DNA helicase RuvB [Patescibacteria group bacterium]
MDSNNISNIRPKKFSDVIGRENEKKSLSILIDSARQRGEAIEHLLFYGPPGLGKTSLSYVIANELGVDIKVTSGPAIERGGDLAAILSNLTDHSVLFIDEIHRLNRNVEEILYPAMEDFVLDIIVGVGPSAKSVRIDLPHFTIIGATTRLGLLSSPLRDRFGAIFRLDFYSVEDISNIIKRSSNILGIKIDDDAISEIAKRSRGTARIANRLLRRVRDYAQVYKIKRITKDVTIVALKTHNIDKMGLDEMDLKILNIIIKNFNGGPVGISSIATALSEDIDTIEEVSEPYLIQEGLIKRTSKGRVATKKAYEYLGIDYNEQLSLI